jgi:hypothetical protein
MFNQLHNFLITKMKIWDKKTNEITTLDFTKYANIHYGRCQSFFFQRGCTTRKSVYKFTFMTINFTGRSRAVRTEQYIFRNNSNLFILIFVTFPFLFSIVMGRYLAAVATPAPKCLFTTHFNAGLRRLAL